MDRQESIIRKIDDLNEQKSELESIYQQKLDALAELRQSLLQMAFSGELTAREAEKDIMEAAA